MKCRKFLSLVLSIGFMSFVFMGQTFAQERQRVVVTGPINGQTTPTRESQLTAARNAVRRPVLTNEVVLAINSKPSEPLVKKTSSSRPTTLPASAGSAGNYSLAAFNQRLLGTMQSKIGIPYVYGSDGPHTYDCSGLVWSVFQSAGLEFTRTSAVNYYRTFEPVYGDERYKFGTLVFFNNLGHVGIVIDENTFYHASQSKGVTFSPFAGYWEKRVVGFRRIPFNAK